MTRITDDGEILEPAAVETLRTHHSRLRTFGKGQRPWRGKGWTTWTGLKGILVARLGEICGGEVKGTGGENWYGEGGG